MTFELELTNRLSIEVTGIHHPKNDIYPGSNAGFEVESAVLIMRHYYPVKENGKWIDKCIRTVRCECPDEMIEFYDDEIQEQWRWECENS